MLYRRLVRWAVLLLCCIVWAPIHADFNQAFEAEMWRVWDPPYQAGGEGVIVGLWEAGSPWPIHPNIAPSLTVVQGSTITSHATHVAGCAVGVGASPTDPTLSRGFAYKAQLFSYTSSGDVTEFTQAATFQNVVVANNSRGSAIGWVYTFIPPWQNFGGQDSFGAYLSQAHDYDQVIYDLDQIGRTFVAVFPAGDDRDDGPVGGGDANDGTYYPNYPNVNPYFDCIDPIATGKNTITVGASYFSSISDFSSWGPTDDGRIKPDLVAHGVNIYSGIAAPELWGNATGTQHAVPAVSGAAAVLIERYERAYGTRPPTAAVKALLLQGADDAGPAGPDPLFGFGHLNVKSCVDTLLFDDGAERRIKIDDIAASQTIEYEILVTDDDEPIKVTLSWIDPPAAVGAMSALINDLDLRLIAPGGGVHYPFRLSAADPTALATATGPNPVDTVEQIVVDTPATGLWRLEIEGTNVPMGPQRFAVVSNRTLNAGAPEPVNVRFQLNADGSSVDITWDLNNDLDLAEYRIYRTSAIGVELELLDIVPANAISYTDVTATDPLLGYDVRAVYQYGSAREVSERTAGRQTPNPRVFLPGEGTSLGSSEPTRILGHVGDRFASVPVLLAPSGTQIGSGRLTVDGLFFLDYDFGVPGSYEVYVQSTVPGLAPSIPSLERTFTLTP